MIKLALVALAFANGPANSGTAPEPVRQDVFSDCVLDEIARQNRTTAMELNSFSKKQADKAFSKCQAAKAQWAIELENSYAADPQFQDATLRKTKVHEVISVDELSVLLMVMMKAK